jgi:hypothetical protein
MFLYSYFCVHHTCLGFCTVLQCETKNMEHNVIKMLSQMSTETRFEAYSQTIDVKSVLSEKLTLDSVWWHQGGGKEPRINTKVLERMLEIRKFPGLLRTVQKENRMILYRSVHDDQCKERGGGKLHYTRTFPHHTQQTTIFWNDRQNSRYSKGALSPSDIPSTMVR